MVDINIYLNAIQTATYGKDVREAILRSIETCYKDTQTGLHQLSGVEDVKKACVSATTAANNAAQRAENAANSGIVSAREDDIGDIVLSY